MNRRQSSFLRNAIMNNSAGWAYTAALWVGALLCLFISTATAVNLNKVLLTIEGDLDGQKNNTVELDLESLLMLEATTFTSKAPWTTEPTEYTGVRISTLLNHIGAESTQFEALASNDYKFTLSDIDFETYPIVIAYKINGEFPDARQLGPLLIMFPFDDYPELLTEKNKAAAVWQLTDLRLN